MTNANEARPFYLAGIRLPRLAMRWHRLWQEWFYSTALRAKKPPAGPDDDGLTRDDASTGVDQPCRGMLSSGVSPMDWIAVVRISCQDEVGDCIAGQRLQRPRRTGTDQMSPARLWVSERYGASREVTADPAGFGVPDSDVGSGVPRGPGSLASTA